MSASRRRIQIAETIAHRAADFLARESNRLSLITVTRAELTPDHRRATVFLSVLPERAEAQVLKFAKRARSDFRRYLMEHTALQRVPLVDFEIDYGEKNRRRVDVLTRQ